VYPAQPCNICCAYRVRHSFCLLLLLLLLPQIRILEESGQLPLAYLAAATHGFEEDAQRLREVRTAAS
jgi:hypothetical protein